MSIIFHALCCWYNVGINVYRCNIYSNAKAKSTVPKGFHRDDVQWYNRAAYPFKRWSADSFTVPDTIDCCRRSDCRNSTSAVPLVGTWQCSSYLFSNALNIAFFLWHWYPPPLCCTNQPLKRCQCTGHFTRLAAKDYYMLTPMQYAGWWSSFPNRQPLPPSLRCWTTNLFPFGQKPG